MVCECFLYITILIHNLDNAPENHSYRTRFVARLVKFAPYVALIVYLAYYPPYHSKHNPSGEVSVS